MTSMNRHMISAVAPPFAVPDGRAAESQREANWYACRTRSRAEKAVSRYLTASRVEAYLPLIEQERQWADRRKVVEFPLFPGYLFARFDPTRFAEVLGAPGLVDVVQLNGRPTPVPPEEIQTIRALVRGVKHTGTLPSPSDYLTVGQRVVVRDGPFKGMRGTLHQLRGAARVVVRLTSIRQAVGVEMDRELLELEDLH